MPNAPEQLAALAPEVFRERLQGELVARYGCWQRAGGSSLTPVAWFDTLAQAVQAEAPDWPTAIELCRFALAETTQAATEASPWADDVLARAASVAVLQTAGAMLQTGATATPEDAQETLRAIRHALRSSHGLRGQVVMDAIRATLTGMQRGPCLGIVVALLGPARVQERIERQLACLQAT